MKKITNYFKGLALFSLLFTANYYNAQCSASFTYSVLPGGVVNFYSTSTPASSVSTTYYWTFGNPSVTYSAMGVPSASATYTATGTYTVNLFFITVPTCSNAVTQTINVTTSSSTVACNLVANCNYSQGSNGLVNFNNTSTGTNGGTTWTWNFGDNTAANTSASPAHTYSANGTYIATLTANNNTTPSCISTKTVAVVVNSYCTLAAGFSYSINSNGNVSFFNSTTASSTITAISYTWSFGNSQNSTSTNPSITYSANGTYTVYLNATQGSCSSATSAVITINNVTGCTLNANFSYSQGTNGLVNFNNTSTGTGSGVTYSWNYGDGGTGTTASPAHTFSANGTYIVSMTANNNVTPACVSTKTMAVIVNSYCNLVAGFNYTLGANGVVNFANTTTGASSVTTGYSWHYGDGGTSTAFNAPAHTYANGTYTVTLYAYTFSSTCVDTLNQVITVTSNTCSANSTFSLVPTGTPKYWNAIPSTTTGISAVQWSWGDGNTSSTLFTSHMYSVSATYTICLSLTVTCGASSSYCSSYYIYKSATGDNGEMFYVDVVAPGTTGIASAEANQIDYSVYPNPAEGLLNLKLKGDGKFKVGVYNVMGAKVAESMCESTNGSYSGQLDLSAEPAGIYFVEVNTGSKTYSKKVVIVK